MVILDDTRWKKLKYFPTGKIALFQKFVFSNNFLVVTEVI